MNNPQSDFVTVRGVKLHVRRWGNPDAPTLFMLHGWMDVSASFQFVVDALGACAGAALAALVTRLSRHLG